MRANNSFKWSASSVIVPTVERDVRNVLGGGQALFDLEVEGAKAVPVVVKEEQRHPVKGVLQHIDLQEVKLDEAIQAEVAIELEGTEVAPGVKEGGVLEHVTREITVEALPTEIPERLVADVSEMEINDTVQLSTLTPPEGVTFVADDLDEITIATLSPPRVEEEPEPDVEEAAVQPEPEPAAEAEIEEKGESKVAKQPNRNFDRFFDLLIMRPVGLVTTVVGGAFFLPAALLVSPSGAEGVQVAWEYFVAPSVERTFKTPLGELSSYP